MKDSRILGTVAIIILSTKENLLRIKIGFLGANLILTKSLICLQQTQKNSINYHVVAK